MSTSTDFKTLEIPVDRVNSYIPPIMVNEADNNGRRLKFTPTYEGQPVTGITSARMYYDPRPRDASSIGDYVDGTKDGDGWVFVIPPNTFTANIQGIASVSFTEEDGETYTRSMPIDVESGGTKADSQGTRIDRLISTLEQMVNDFTMTAEAETGEASSQANVTVNRTNGGAYNLKFVIPRGDKGDTGDAATIQLGTVTTGNPGTNAEINNSGTENNAVFNFTIPRGDVGPAGVNENVPLGTASGIVAQATDAYPTLPRKVQVHGLSGVQPVEPEKLIYTGKNIVSPFKQQTYNGVTVSPTSDGGFTLKGTTERSSWVYFCKSIPIPAGVKHVYAYIDKAPQFTSQNGSFLAFQVIQTDAASHQVAYTNITKGSLVKIVDTAKVIFFQVYATGGQVQCVENVVYHPQIEFSDSFNGFSKPEEIKEIELPEGISLADGDTLTIDRDGTTQIVHAEGEPTVLENVTLPELPAPTFNVYTTGGNIQPTVDVDYEQDVNLVLQALEAKIASLEVNQTIMQ